MKKIIFVILGIFVSCGIHAQDVIAKGDNVISGGVGAGQGFPIAELSYEYCMVDNIFGDNNGAYGLGAYTCYNEHNDHKNLTLGCKEYLHYQFVDDLDTYGTLMLGLKLPVDRSFSHTRFQGSIGVGARYYFSPGVAWYGEVGYGVCNLSVGVSFKF